MCETKIYHPQLCFRKLPNGKYLCPSCGTLLGGLQNMDERERKENHQTELLGWENSVLTPMFHFSFNVNIF